MSILYWILYLTLYLDRHHIQTLICLKIMMCVETLQSVFRLRDRRDTCHVAGAGSEGSEERMHTSLGRHSLLYTALLAPSPSGPGQALSPRYFEILAKTIVC